MMERDILVIVLPTIIGLVAVVALAVLLVYLRKVCCKDEIDIESGRLSLCDFVVVCDTLPYINIKASDFEA